MKPPAYQPAALAELIATRPGLAGVGLAAQVADVLGAA